MTTPTRPSRGLAASGLNLCLCLSQARTPEYPLMAAACGFDAIYVDLEHASTSLETASMLCIAAAGAGLTALVRTPSLDPPLITRVLDGGAHGVIVPHVDTPEEAQRVVDVCRFPPLGKRLPIASNAVTRFADMSPSEAMAAIEAQTVVALMLESPQGVAEADRIAAIGGVDMLLIGAFDLSAELGITGQFGHQRFREAVREVSAACRRHGVLMGLAGVSDPALLADYVADGVGFLSGGTDASLFMEAARRRTAELRSLPTRPRQSSTHESGTNE